MSFTLKYLAEKINAPIIGDENRKICGVAAFDDASSHDITFASDIKFLKHLSDTDAGAVIVPVNHGDLDTDSLQCSILLSENPKLHFFRIVSLFYPQKKSISFISPVAQIGENFVFGTEVTVHSGVTIGDGVVIGARVCLMPGVYVGDNVTIGDGTIIKPNVSIMERSFIGKRVIIHSNTVIGSDGFGFTPDHEKHEKIPHAGFVRIDDDVEIGACNTIDRGTFGKTWIGKGVKTDNLVHIAHNVIIGKNTLIVAQVGIAGSSKIGNNVIIAGQAGVSGHLTIGDYSIVGPRAGVAENVPAGKIVSGIPGMPHKLWLRVANIIPRLPDLRKKLLSLERRVKKCEQSVKNGHGKPLDGKGTSKK